MKHKMQMMVLCSLMTILIINATQSPILVYSQGVEPRFSFPGTRRFVSTSYFYHSNPDVYYNTIDDKIDIYTTERGQRTNNCFDCYQSGSVQVCGYYTVLQNAANCGAAGGWRIYYDMHPAFDYAFPMNTAIAAASSGVAYRRTILGSAIVIDHGNNYFTKYGHVNPDSRVADGTSVVRGQQVALSSNTGTGAAHLHFEARYNGEYGTVFDPYGWQGPWYTDNWNLPFGHTEPWWRSDDPLPVGYRDQNHTVHGPFQLSDAIASKWDSLDGAPGSPVSAKVGGGCPGTYGDCQFFEKGYLRWDYSSVTYFPYAETLTGNVNYVASLNSNTILSIQNLGGVSAQISVIYLEKGHIVDSRTYKALASAASWQLKTQQALYEITGSFIGTAAIYSSQPLAFTIAYINPLPTQYLPFVVK